MDDLIDKINITLAVLGTIGYIVNAIRILNNRVVYSGDLFLLYVMLIASCCASNFSFIFFFEESLCNFQASLMIFADLSMLILNVVLVLQTYHFISFRTKLKSSMWIRLILLGYVLPFLISIILYSLGMYANEGKWCWVTSKTWPGYICSWVFITSQLLLMLFNAYVSYTARQIYFENVVNIEIQGILQKYYKIFWFSWIQIIAFVYNDINSIITKILDHGIKNLQISVSIICNSLGIIHMIVFHYIYKNAINSEEETLIESVD
jgi:hypothetical protein